MRVFSHVSAACPAAALPPVGHVFVLVLENEGYDKTFGAKTEAPYLATELAAKGALLTRYFGTGHASLGNYIAMISGQTFDEGDETGDAAKTGGGRAVTFAGASCCHQVPGPNLGAFPQTLTFGTTDYVTDSFGGERIGAVLLSRFIKPGTVSAVEYNHYSLLRSVEDLLHLDGHLGYAGQDGLVGFGDDVFAAGHGE